MNYVNKICLVLVALFLLPSTLGLKAGIVVDVQGDVYSGCIELYSGQTAHDLMVAFDDVNDNFEMTIDGGTLGIPAFLRAINGIEGEAVGDNAFSGWNFWISENDNSFEEPPELAPGWGMGIGDYKLERENEVIGVNFGVTEFNPDWTVKTLAQKPDYISHLQLCNMFDIEEIKVTVDGKKESGADEDGGKIDIKPGSEIELKIKLENLYDRKGDIEIKDIFLEAILEDIDDGDDLEADSNEFDLDAGDDKTVKFNFDVPMSVDDEVFDLILKIEGENEFGHKFDDVINFEVEVDKEKHDIIFNNFDLIETDVKCGSIAELKMELMNVGSNEEPADLNIKSEELGINILESFTLSEDPDDKENKFLKNYKLSLPSELKQGTYRILATLNYGQDSETEYVDLNVNCETSKNNALEFSAADEEVEELSEPKKSEQKDIKITGMSTVQQPSLNKVSSNRKTLIAGIFFIEILVLIAAIIALVFILRK